MRIGPRAQLIGGLIVVVTGFLVAATSFHQSSSIEVAPIPSVSIGTPPSTTVSLSPEALSAPRKSSQATASSVSTTLAGDPVRVTVQVEARVLIDAQISGPANYDPKTDVLVPQGFGAASWFANGWPKPGEPGPAVIVGHIDSKQGPDVFWNLQAVDEAFQSGRHVTITVWYPYGEKVTFVVTDTQRFAKTDLPKKRIWAVISSPVLRLITCDPSTPFNGSHYAGNIAVYADQLV